MKHSTLSCLAVLALAAASPLPHIEYVTVTHYTTIQMDFTPYAGATGYAETPKAYSPSTSTIDSESVPTSSAPTQAAELIESTKAAETVQTSASTNVPIAETSTVSSTSLVNSEPAATSTQGASSNPTASSTADNTSAGETFSGEGTFYKPGLGSCGSTNNEGELVVAISHELYDQYTPNGNPNKNPLCGRKINAHYKGKSVEVTVVDRCEGCKLNDLDFSPTAFSNIADRDAGRVDITWDWAN